MSRTSLIWNGTRGVQTLRMPGMLFHHASQIYSKNDVKRLLKRTAIGGHGD